MFQSTVVNRPLAIIHKATAHHQLGVEPTGLHTHHLRQDILLILRHTHPIHNQVVSQGTQDQPLILFRPQCQLLVDINSHQLIIQLEGIINLLIHHRRDILEEGIPPARVGILLILRYGYSNVFICECINEYCVYVIIDLSVLVQYKYVNKCILVVRQIFNLLISTAMHSRVYTLPSNQFRNKPVYAWTLSIIN